MLLRVCNLAFKEFIQLVRDRMMAIFILLFPIVQLVLLTQATGKGIDGLSLAILDQDRSAQSRGLAQALDNVPELAWQFEPASQDELRDLIDTGQAVVGVVIPPDFGKALVGARLPIDVQMIVDASNTVVASTARSAAEGVIKAYTGRILAGQAVASGASAPTGPAVVLHALIRYNPALNARLYTVPAQMGFIIYQVTLAIASLAFARERELGTLEQLLVTPLHRLELITGKAALALALGALDFLFMYWLVVRLYAIPMRGSFWLLFGLSLLFVGVEIGYGVIISSFARSQQQAILYVFLLAMLDVALSGYLVPVKNMPGVFRTLAQASPMQHYLIIIRAIMLKGAGLALLLPHVLALAGIGTAIGFVALGTATRSLE